MHRSNSRFFLYLILLATFILIPRLGGSAQAGHRTKTRENPPPGPRASLPSEHPNIRLARYANGLNLPTDIANTGVPGDERLFITEKDGAIRIVLPGGNLLPTPFLQIDDRVRSGDPERGLLGLVFDLDFENNGYFYVNYTFGGAGGELDGDTFISRFQVSAGDPRSLAHRDGD